MPQLLDVGGGVALGVSGSGIAYAPQILTKRFTICYPNYVDEATISGTGVDPAFPLTELQSTVYADKAHSLGLTGMQIRIVLPRPRRMGAFAIPRHNMTNAGQWRVRCYYDLAETNLKYDSGLKRVWPRIYSIKDVEFEYDNYWTRNVRNEDRHLYSALATAFADSNELIRVVVIDLVDPFNPEGYISLGRVFMAPVWQPLINMDWGSQYGMAIDTSIETAGDGTEYFDVLQGKRTLSVVLPWLSKDEAFGQVYAGLKTQGVHGEVLVADDLTIDKTYMHRVFMGRYAQPNPITHPRLVNYDGSLLLQERT